MSQNYGHHLGGPYSKDYSILGSIFGSPCLGKLPLVVLGIGVEGLGFRVWGLEFRI